MADPIRSAVSSGEDPWLTVPQVADDLNIHPATVRSWIKTGRLAAVRAGRTWRVRGSDVDRALLMDPSPALTQGRVTPATGTSIPFGPTPAPRQIADHILTVTATAAHPS
jgi:excisionase family DNA binding protein